MHLLRATLLFLMPALVTEAEERVAWTTSQIEGSPEPPPPYAAEVIWPHITFDEGLDLTFLKSEERLFVTEQSGKIWMLPADLNAHPEKAELAADLQQFIPEFRFVYGLTFHPEFRKNRELFVFYRVNFSEDELATRVSRFRMDDRLKIIPSSEELIVTFGGGGHNGGDVQFGADGMLYFTVGDLSPPSPPDPYNEGQNLRTLASTIVRIDIDRKDPGLAYRIPEDNPFVDHEGVRPEIWAFGFRNPWKMCFDPVYGDIWTGDVGWELWEMVFRVEKGGNYGWSIMEGPTPTKPDQPMGPVSISPPALYYPHTEGASVTGGFFPSSSRLPALKGKYIYGDYMTGKIWALEWNGKRVVTNEFIADTRKKIVTFGKTLEGDLIFMNHPNESRLYRLVPNPKTGAVNHFPKRLGQTGIFKNLTREETNPGVYAFSIQAPMWQDGYKSRYWIGIPGKSRFESQWIQNRGIPLIRWETSPGTVVVKTIHSGHTRIETQILHFDGSWNGYTYRWNDDQTDATLVPKEGLDTIIADKPYRFPSRDECTRCHGSNFNWNLAFFPSQLNREGQLDRFYELGVVDERFVEMGRKYPLENPYDEMADLALRSRSWLHANCSHCHRRSGGSSTTTQMNISAPDHLMALIDTLPAKGYFGLGKAPLIDPGDPYQSVLYYRMATRGAGHMPMVGAKTLDREGMRLIHDWIRGLDSITTPIAEASMTPKNVEEALALYHRIQSGELSQAEIQRAIAACLSHPDPFVINLFAGFSHN